MVSSAPGARAAGWAGSYGRHMQAVGAGAAERRLVPVLEPEPQPPAVSRENCGARRLAWGLTSATQAGVEVLPHNMV